MANERYLNFPVVLLDSFLTDTNEVLSNIVAYACYRMIPTFGTLNEYDAMSQTMDYFGLTITDVQMFIDRGGALYNSIDLNSPMVGLNCSTFFQYRNNFKTEFEKVCLLAHLGLRSILQNKPYCKITNIYLLSRMDGKSKAVESFNELSEALQKYCNNYQIRKFKAELVDSWSLKTYSYKTRGFYVSYKLDLNKLVFEAEKRRKKYKDKKRKNDIKEAVKLANLKLANSPANDNL